MVREHWLRTTLLGNSDLGFEIDLVVTYELIDGLNLDLVGAYLFADDATTQVASGMRIRTRSVPGFPSASNLPTGKSQAAPAVQGV